MSAPSSLDAHLGFLLRMVSNAVSHNFARKLADEGVTVAEWVMLRAMFDKDEITPSVLADELGMTRGAISKLADRLAGKHLITRTADPDDRRGQLLALLPAGRALVPLLANHADRNDAEYFELLCAPERFALAQTLRKLIAGRNSHIAPLD